jgi:hypothetical protein
MPSLKRFRQSSLEKMGNQRLDLSEQISFSPNFWSALSESAMRDCILSSPVVKVHHMQVWHTYRDPSALMNSDSWSQ